VTEPNRPADPSTDDPDPGSELGPEWLDDANWVAVAASADLTAGATLAVEAFGAKLVAFRTESGRICVVGRFCPHLGANFARLGMVDGEFLRCGSHHWAFDHFGACVAAPGEETLPTASVAVVRARDIDGRIEVAGVHDLAGS
jgi:phenylpropionate dioxygenase-like ring-hydroxylating dioxygenase large terminal subunit